MKKLHALIENKTKRSVSLSLYVAGANDSYLEYIGKAIVDLDEDGEFYVEIREKGEMQSVALKPEDVRRLRIRPK
jgi:capsid portal protein